MRALGPLRRARPRLVADPRRRAGARATSADRGVARGRPRREPRSPSTSPPISASGAPWEDFERGNVEGTENALAAAAAAGVRRFVHCGTEAALMAGDPLVHVDEAAPLRPDSPAPYPATKARAELAVRRANRAGFETVTVRPRFVWGRGDTTLLPEMVRTVGRRVMGLGRRRPQRHRHGPRRQRRRGTGAGGREGPAGRGLLRHRRRAGRLPRVRHRDDARPRASSRPTAASPPGRRAPLARRLGGRLEDAAVEGRSRR